MNTRSLPEILLTCFITIHPFHIENPDAKIFSISIPKSGTHLIRKCLEKMTGRGLMIGHIGASDFTTIDKDRLVSTSNKYFFGIHPLPTKHHINLLKKHNFKAIFIYRDPRDLVISMAYYIKANNWPAGKLPVEDLIMKLITNYSIVYGPEAWQCSKWLHLKGIDDFYHHYLPWANQPFVYVTTFEKLVGSKGGGSANAQLQEINNIASHIGISLTEQDIEKITNNMFGDSPTFRSGQIGAWKKGFTTTHKTQFKKKAGQLLIDLGYESDFNW